jgi:hypothetical protein
MKPTTEAEALDKAVKASGQPKKAGPDLPLNSKPKNFKT